jgi:serine/threonine-protein kinase
MQEKTDRRTFLAAAGVTASTIALAGCSGGDGGDGGDGDGGNGDGGDGDGGMDNGDTSVPDEVDSYLSEEDANLYEGEAADETGSDSVSIAVGAGDVGLAYDPACVRVDSGTEVTWEWTGEGGAHNVVSTDNSATEFNSGEAVDSDSETFSQTFDSAGNQLYYCTPHRANGKVGAVIVE